MGVLQSVGGKISNETKKIGAQIGDLNPLKTPDAQTAGAEEAAKKTAELAAALEASKPTPTAPPPLPPIVDLKAPTPVAVQPTAPGTQVVAQPIAQPTAVTATQTNAAGAPVLVDRAGVANAGAGTTTGLSSTDSIAQALAQQEQLRSQQMGLINQYQQKLSGQAGPSAAENALLRQAEDARAQTLGAALGARGGIANQAIAQRNAQRGVADIQQQTQAKVGDIRLAEEADNRKALNELLTGARTADLQAGNLAQTSAATDLAVKAADMDRVLKADLANQGIDLEVLKANANAGNEAAKNKLAEATANADRTLAAQRATLDAQTQTNIQSAEQALRAQAANQADATQRAISQADNQLKASLANQNVNLDVLKFNAQRGDIQAQQNIANQLAFMGLDQQALQNYFQNMLGVNAQQANIKGAIDQAVNAAAQQKAASRASVFTAVTGGMSQIGAAAATGGASAATPKLASPASPANPANPATTSGGGSMANKAN